MRTSADRIDNQRSIFSHEEQAKHKVRRIRGILKGLAKIRREQANLHLRMNKLAAMESEMRAYLEEETR